MFEAIRARLLRVLRVPHDPDPPAGAPGSVRVFRAGRNYYKLRLARWGLGQIGALVGIIFSLLFLQRLEREVENVRGNAPRANAPAAPVSAPSPDAAASNPATAPAEPPRPNRKARRNRPENLRRLAEKTPLWLFPVLKLLEAGGVLLYLLQIPLTYGLARLDYELRWYMVSDRSLRIRAGVTTVSEATMSFANVQQVVVSQGPLQRLLGIADVRVQSAGGGGDHEEHGGDSLHTGVFHGVDNAREIRDLILERLRLFRAAGLGDPDDATHAAPAPLPIAHEPPPLATDADVAAAAQELLAEARALRRAVG